MIFSALRNFRKQEEILWLIPHSPQSIGTQLVAKQPAVFVTGPSGACSRKGLERKQPRRPLGRQLCINALARPPQAQRECAGSSAAEHNPSLHFHQTAANSSPTNHTVLPLALRQGPTSTDGVRSIQKNGLATPSDAGALAPH